jgi:hypothetical protein
MDRAAIPNTTSQSLSDSLGTASMYRAASVDGSPSALRQAADVAFVVLLGVAFGVVLAAYLWSSP